MAVIYKITNIINNKCYIGSTNSFNQRKMTHLYKLRTNKHANIYLQRAYNKNSEKSFVFTILATCPIEYKFKLEQWFLDTQKYDYNILTTAIGVLGRKCSEKTKNKMSKSHKKRFKDPNQRLIQSLNRSKYITHKWSDPVFAKMVKDKNTGENHPQSTITNKIARLIKIDIYNNIPKDIIIKTYNISKHIYKSIKANKSWKNIII
jgi:group I intron endonuclease